MAENSCMVPCPMCHGDGQMHRSDAIRKLSDPELGSQIRTYLEEITHDSPHSRQPLETAATAKDRREPSERELHAWPARHPLGRRSPKE